MLLSHAGLDRCPHLLEYSLYSPYSLELASPLVLALLIKLRMLKLLLAKAIENFTTAVVMATVLFWYWQHPTVKLSFLDLQLVSVLDHPLSGF